MARCTAVHSFSLKRTVIIHKPSHLDTFSLSSRNGRWLRETYIFRAFSQAKWSWICTHKFSLIEPYWLIYLETCTPASLIILSSMSSASDSLVRDGLYPYHPSHALPAVFAALVGISFVVHIWQNLWVCLRALAPRVPSTLLTCQQSAATSSGQPPSGCHGVVPCSPWVGLLVASPATIHQTRISTLSRPSLSTLGRQSTQQLHITSSVDCYTTYQCILHCIPIAPLYSLSTWGRQWSRWPPLERPPWLQTLLSLRSTRKGEPSSQRLLCCKPLLSC